MAVNIHITIIELNALHTKRQNLFQELDAVIHLLMEAKHWGLRKSRNATSLNSRFKTPSGDLQERVLIRHHDYDQCFQSVQLLQWNSQVKFNVTVYRNLPTTRD